MWGRPHITAAHTQAATLDEHELYLKEVLQQIEFGGIRRSARKLPHFVCPRLIPYSSVLICVHLWSNQCST